MLSVTPMTLSSDGRTIQKLLRLHAPQHPRILDATYATGVMWRGLDYRPVRMDRRDGLELDARGDWGDIPRLFGPASFDVIVFDPPHVVDAGDGIVGQGEWSARYGTTAPQLTGTDNIGHLYGGFLHAARAVLVPRTGIVIAKIADQVHRGAQQWQHVDFVTAARAAGFTPCDYDIKQRSATMRDPKWRHRYHLDKPWSFWIVARAGSSCIGPGELRARQCSECPNPLDGRGQQQTCSDRCRTRRRRRLHGLSQAEAGSSCRRWAGVGSTSA
jgi:hypothetical protein